MRFKFLSSGNKVAFVAVVGTREYDTVIIIDIAVAVVSHSSLSMTDLE